MGDEKVRRDDASISSGSTADGPPALTTVAELMEERRRYEAWLQTLEARRGETPKHVFTRVHADYTARLEAVISRLTTHADGMRAALTALTTRLANLDEQQHRARDERAEAELRAHVGELAPDAWQRLKEASDAEIADLARKHAETAAELERTRALVADAERPATPVPASSTVTARTVPGPKPPAPRPVAPSKSAGAPGRAPAASVEPPDSAEAELHVPTGEQQTVSADAGAGEGAAQTGQDDFDELAFLQSVVDAPTVNGVAKTPRAEARPEPRAEPRAVVSPRPAAPRPAPVAPAPAAAAPPQPPASRIEPPAPPPNPMADLHVSRAEPVAPKLVPKGGGLAANVSGNNPVVLKDKAADSGKTLKCAECGALNYPTEWYCERCGAELASL